MKSPYIAACLSVQSALSRPPSDNAGQEQGSATVRYETFAEGWLQEGNAWGRPVDLQELPDGSLLISDARQGHPSYQLSTPRSTQP